MSVFDEETAVTRIADDRWSAHVSSRWHIGDNPNGGYLAAIALRAVREVTDHPDPISVTTHFLRPGTGDQAAEVVVELVRTGRTITTVRATLLQAGTARLIVLAAFADLAAPSPVEAALTIPAPAAPPPDDCPSRSDAEQGIALPILDRLDVRVVPSTGDGEHGESAVSGWIRLRDGTDPDAFAVVLFADAYPPSLFGRFGAVGWVPSVELTVHVRRRPAPGWVFGRFSTRDLDGGRMIEDGALWDSAGALVAQSRQIGLLLPR